MGKLYLTDHLDNRIDDIAMSFILSLAPNFPMTIAKLGEIFVDDKLGYEYYAMRQAQLNKSITHSQETGQIKLYEDIFIPGRQIVSSSPRLELDTRQERQTSLQIDSLMDDLSRVITGGYDPLNISSRRLLAKSNKNNPEMDQILKLSKEIRDLDAKRPYIAPEGKKLKTIQIPAFKPNIQLAQSELLNKGYFTGLLNQHFHVEPINKKTASAAMRSAKSSLLPFYDEIIKNNLNNTYINTYYRLVVYTSE